MDKGFTKSDLDMVSTIYKFLDKSIKKVWFYLLWVK
jgi:hypothetical protein